MRLLFAVIITLLGSNVAYAQRCGQTVFNPTTGRMDCLGPATWTGNNVSFPGNVIVGATVLSQVLATTMTNLDAVGGRASLGTAGCVPYQTSAGVVTCSVQFVYYANSAFHVAINGGDNVMEIQQLAAATQGQSAIRYLDVNGREMGAIGYGNQRGGGGNTFNNEMFIAHGEVTGGLSPANDFALYNENVSSGHSRYIQYRANYDGAQYWYPKWSNTPAMTLDASGNLIVPAVTGPTTFTGIFNVTGTQANQFTVASTQADFVNFTSSSASAANLKLVASTNNAEVRYIMDNTGGSVAQEWWMRVGSNLEWQLRDATGNKIPIRVQNASPDASIYIQTGVVAFANPISISTVTPIGSVNAAVCWKTTTTLGFCSSVVGAGGTCTCS
jgi:hypothetical protein